MTTPRQNKTPAERSAVVARAHSRAKKTYKTDITRKRTNVTPEELEIITQQLVALKVVGGYSNTQCASIVGLSRGQVNEIVRDEKFTKKVSTVKESLPKAAVALGQAYLVESVQAVVHVMRTEKDNALVLRAAAEMFDRFGIPKLTKTEIKSDTGEPDPLTAKDGGLMKKVKSASPEMQEAVAALHESFLEGVERIMGGEVENGTD